jgi:hypothetical protein
VRFAARSDSESIYLTTQGPALSAQGRRVDISLVNANPSPMIEPLDQLPGRVDYYVGSRAKWRAGVPQFARVAYRSVLPGIDVVYYGKRDQLEYDLILQPGADPRAIRWKLRGAEHVGLTPDGDLLVESGGATFLQKRPFLYQQNGPVPGRYILLPHGIAGVQVDAYDRSQPLVIDPVLAYGTFLGGMYTDVLNALQLDSQGRMVVVGSTTGNDLPANYYQAGIDGETNCFVAIVWPQITGAPSLWRLTYLGGSSNDACTAVAIDSSDNVYVTGTTTSQNFPLAGNSVQSALTLSASETTFESDIFVSAFNFNIPEDLFYSTYYGGSGGDTPNAIAIDQNGLIYVLGTTASTDFPVTANAYASVLWGPSDVFILQLSLNGTSALYASYIGGESYDDGRGLVIAPSGLVYFAASTFSTEFPLAGQSYLSNLQGTENIIIGVMDLTQTGSSGLVYATYYGGSVSDEVRNIVFDSQGRLLLTGWTLSPDFPVTSTAMQSQASPNGNAFASRLNVLGGRANFLNYSTVVGGSGGDVAYGIASDASGSIYLAGYTLSTDFPVTSDAVQTQYQNGVEAFLVKFNPSVAGMAALQYGSYFGGTGIHVATGLAVGPNGIYLTGYTGEDQQTTSSSFQPTYGGGYSDGFAFFLQQETPQVRAGGSSELPAHSAHPAMTTAHPR